MSKVGVVLQVLIVVMLAIIIALVVYYGTNSPKSVKSHMPPVRLLIRPPSQMEQGVIGAQTYT